MNNSHMLSKNPILHDFKLFWDYDADARGDAISRMFDICHVLHALSGSSVPAPDELNPHRCYGDLIPAHWEFTAGWSGSPTDLREAIAEDQDETGGLAEWYFDRGIEVEDMVYAGNVLSRWIAIYDANHPEEN